MGQFARLALLGVTLALLLIGFAVSGSDVSSGTVTIAALTGVLFHIGVYVANDVVDADTDRTDSRRAHTPIASGAVSPRTGLWVAGLALLVGTALLWWWESNTAAAVSYLSGAVCLLVYDFFGKRFPWPPVTDFVQGAGWGALILAGNALTGRHITIAAALFAASICCYVMITTGVLGSLRDFSNDVRHGARTTASMFLGRVEAVSSGRLPRPYFVYALVCQCAKAATCVSGLVLLEHASRPWYLPAVGLGCAGEVLCLVLLWRGMRSYRIERGIWLMGLAYIVLNLWCVLLAVLVTFGPGPYLVTMAVSLAPLTGSLVVRSLVSGGTHWRGREAGPE